MHQKDRFSADATQFLVEALEKNAFSLPLTTQKKLVDYLELLNKWNRTFNLTALTEPQAMVYLHLVDSLMIQSYLQGPRLLDVGSGAGLPGIPLAILNPNQHLVLLDKNSKKTRFLTQAAAELHLNNVEIVHHRCEDFHPEEGFASIISRAFGTIAMFLAATEHLLCHNGLFIAMKGKYPQTELRDIPDHFTIREIARLDIKGIDVERHIICLTKK